MLSDDWSLLRTRIIIRKPSYLLVDNVLCDLQSIPKSFTSLAASWLSYVNITTRSPTLSPTRAPVQQVGICALDLVHLRPFTPRRSTWLCVAVIGYHREVLHPPYARMLFTFQRGI